MSKTRSLETVTASPGNAGEMLAAVRAALAGGPAVLPLPAAPEPARTSLLDALRPDLPLEEGAALVVPTSGSTGEPKGVLLTADAVLASADATHVRLGGPGRWLLALPTTHIAGLMVLARSVVASVDPVVQDLSEGFDPESFAAASVRLLAESKRRYTALVPKQLADIVRDGGCGLEALAAYDAVLLGGSAAAPDLITRARAAGIQLVPTYGTTETCGGCVYDGIALEGVKVEVGPDERIRLAGPMLALGYRLRPELTNDAFAHGWFVTADAGRIDADGRLHVIGRIDDIAITGGVNVPLAAVDAAVTSHPEVENACAVALPDAEWGERIVVAVVAAAGCSPTLKSVRAHVMKSLPTAYAPKELIVVDALPMLAGQKVDRHTMTTRLLEGLAG
jgi:O-succinylbenzoic acid--CoA ligase